MSLMAKRWSLTAPWRLSALFWNCVCKFRIWFRCGYYADNCSIENVRIILVLFRFYDQIMQILSALLNLWLGYKGIANPSLFPATWNFICFIFPSIPKCSLFWVVFCLFVLFAVLCLCLCIYIWNMFYLQFLNMKSVILIKLLRNATHFHWKSAQANQRINLILT